MGYNSGHVYANGTPSGYTNGVPRDLVQENTGNLIDGGAGDDFIAAGTANDYVHTAASNDNNWRQSA